MIVVSILYVIELGHFEHWVCTTRATQPSQCRAAVQIQRTNIYKYVKLHDMSLDAKIIISVIMTQFMDTEVQRSKSSTRMSFLSLNCDCNDIWNTASSWVVGTRWRTLIEFNILNRLKHEKNFSQSMTKNLILAGEDRMGSYFIFNTYIFCPFSSLEGD